MEQERLNPATVRLGAVPLSVPLFLKNGTMEQKWNRNGTEMLYIV